MQKPTRVILTRPAFDMGGWQAALSEAGFEVEHLPLIAIDSLAEQAKAEAAASGIQPANFSAIFFVSRSAVDCFVQVFALPPNMPLLAPGPGTATALLQHGAVASQLIQPDGSAQFDSESLWPVLQSKLTIDAAFRLLIIKGEDAGEAQNDRSARFMQAQISNLGGSSAQLVLYRRRAPEFTVAQAELAQTAASDGSVWIFTSSQGISNLIAALADTAWENARCIATHPRIAQTAREAGFGQVEQCQPEMNALVHCLHHSEWGI